MPRFWTRLRLTLDMIKFEHSCLRCPLLLTGALLAWRDSGFHDSGSRARASRGLLLRWLGRARPPWHLTAFSMRKLMARNRRTANRHLPAGLLSTGFAWGFTFASSLVFLWAARELGSFVFFLAPVALAILFFYSFSKRFTLLSHMILGFCLGIAPAAAWIAMRGTLDPRILWLTAAVMFWTAGFDVIYACQDFEFDCAEGLCSIPRRFGVGGALLHRTCFTCGDDRLPAGAGVFVSSWSFEPAGSRGCCGAVGL